MAKYTTEVRSICEFYAGLDESTGYTGVDDVISSALPKIFDFDFPIFDENYRAVLERKIIMHYYTREIGFETVALWKLWLNKELNEIMPYFNKLYLSEQFEYDPLHDVDYYIDHAGVGTHKGEKNTDGTTKNSGTDTREIRNTGTDTREIRNTGTDSRNISEQGTNTGTTTDQGNRTGNSTTNEDKDMWDKYSDTPQGTVSNLDNSTYLTNARNITEDNTEQTTSTETNSNTRTDNLAHSKNITDALAHGHNVEDSLEHGHNVEDSLEHGMNVKNDERETNDIKTTDDFLRHVYGKMGTVPYSDMILKYRETLLNIDMLIIKELSDLFFNLW